jgi:DNA-binding IclR family transcriptional regulator
MVTKLLNDLREGGYLRQEADGRWRLLKALPRK